VNAFDLIPVKDILVMLYLDDNDTVPFDSLPYLVPPLNATRTGEDGKFRVNNLKLTEYKLFALEDVNNNYIYDLPMRESPFSIPSPFRNISLPSQPAERNYLRMIPRQCYL